MELRKMKVVKVTKDYFELDDGSIYDHIESLEEVPTVEEFQKIYDSCYNFIVNGENNDR